MTGAGARAACATPERYERVKRVFEAAVEQPPTDRLAFVATTCGDDLSLRMEVESLLQAHEASDGFLATPLGRLIGDTPSTVSHGAGPQPGPAPEAAPPSLVGGRYAIECEIGRGGMGIVYLARDLREERPVAVKLLRAALASSVDVERFLREARFVSACRHPRILPLLDVGAVDGRPYLVTPWVDGESLRDRLTREPQLPVEDALLITRQIADALTHAHAQGVLHRDVSPGNILLSAEGALLADFGIARAIYEAGDERLTSTGVVVGTPAYMSPEQGSGERTLDPRSDEYALASVAYAMLAGQPPFTGPTVQSVIAQKTAHEPQSVRRLRPSVPEYVDAALQRALSPVPADRFASVDEFAAALEGQPHAGHGDGAADAPARALAIAHVGVLPPRATSAHRARRRLSIPFGRVATVVLGLVVAALAFRAGRQASAGSTDESFTFAVPPPEGFEFADNLANESAISPDGRQIVFAATDSTGRDRLWVRALSERTARPIRGTDFSEGPFWSPDGRSIAFFQSSRLMRASIGGTTAEPLGPASSDARGGSWGRDGTILYAPGPQSGIFATAIGARAPRRLTSPARARGEIGHMWPQLLPGDESFLYYVDSDADSVRGIYVASVRSPRGRRVVGSPAGAVFADGYLLYIRDGVLVAQPFDLRTLSLSGDPHPLADSVAVSFEHRAMFSASQNGRLLYASGRTRDVSRLWWVDSAGRRLTPAYPELGYFRNPLLSRDGRWLVFEEYQESEGHLRMIDVSLGTSLRLTDSATQALTPVLSPHGEAVAYVAQRPGGWGVYRRTIGRSGMPELLRSFPHYTILTDWSPDGHTLLLTQSADRGYFKLVAMPVAPSGSASVVASAPGHQVSGRFSPDGRHIAYVSTESGEPQVYIAPWPTTGERCQVSPTEGSQPAWGRTAGHLYFLSRNGVLMGAALRAARGAPCLAAVPRALFQTPIREPSTARSHFDVSPVDGRILLNVPTSAGADTWLNVVVNWPAAMDAKH